MEYTRSYFQRDVVRSRYNKLKNVLQKVPDKNEGATNQEKPQRKGRDKCINKTTKKTSNKCQDIQVRETYDEVLDLRNAVISNLTKNGVKNCISKKSSNAEQTFLNKVCEIPNMHYKIMTLCSVKNSNKFSEQFNTKTNIISERIVNKQLELQAVEKPPVKTKPVCKVIPKFGENIVAQKIIEKEKELQQKKLPKKVQKIKLEKPKSNTSSKSLGDRSRENTPSRPRFQLSTKPDIKTSKTSACFEIARSRFQRSIMGSMNKTSASKPELPDEKDTLEMKKSNVSKSETKARSSSWERSKPRFLLSTKPTGRCAVSHSCIQVSMEKSSLSANTQTENMLQLRSIQAQTYKKNITNEKKMQTRLCKVDNVETSPILFEGPAKYTSTTCDYYRSEQRTQTYEHLTTSDLVCLDWVNRHLFRISVNPHNIIVDDKIKEVSEVASKSTFFSDMESLALPK